MINVHIIQNIVSLSVTDYANHRNCIKKMFNAYLKDLR